MIKGINRQIIEVTDTGNEYFERALLIVRSTCCDTDSNLLHQQAKEMLRHAGTYGGLRINRRKRRLHSLLIALGGSVAGLVLGALLTQFIF